MKKKSVISILLIVSILLIAGCGSNKDSQPSSDAQEEQSEEIQESDGEEKSQDSDSQVASSSEMAEVEEVVEDWMVPIEGSNLKDGTYDIDVASSSSMFKIENCQLTVNNGEMTAIMTMGGTGYTYLFMGTGEEAVAADESEYIPHQEDSEGKHTFEVPVEALDKGIDCTAFSTKKEKWYDRTLVFRSDKLPLDAFRDGFVNTAASLGLADGEYQADIELVGGSGKATIDSPTTIKIQNGECIAVITWSSPNYDYMLVNGEKYLPTNTEGNSVFEIPVGAIDRFVPVVADTTAMSTPYEIDYMIKIDSSSITG